MEIRILLIDDDQEFLEQSKLLWEKQGEGVGIDIFSDPIKALDKMENTDYDAIVADYKMPEMDGLEILKVIRDRGDKTPFIILTGKGGEEIAMEALNLEADKYIIKGTDPKEQYKKIIDTIFDRPIS